MNIGKFSQRIKIMERMEGIDKETCLPKEIFIEKLNILASKDNISLRMKEMLVGEGVNATRVYEFHFRKVKGIEVNFGDFIELDDIKYEIVSVDEKDMFYIVLAERQVK